MESPVVKEQKSPITSMSKPTVYMELPLSSGNNNPDEAVKCPKCDRQFIDGKKLSNHFYHAHGNLYYQCLMCNYLQRRPGRIKIHIVNTHHINESCVSKYWKRVYKNEKGTRIRLKERKNKVQVKVERGDYNRKNYYKKRTMSWIRCFNCYDCNSSFKSVGELFSHVKIHKDSSEEI